MASGDNADCRLPIADCRITIKVANTAAIILFSIGNRQLAIGNAYMIDPDPTIASNLRQTVLRNLAAAIPDLVAQPTVSPDGMALAQVVDELIRIARRTAATRANAYTVQVIDGVCSLCANAMFSGHCRMRQGGQCQLYPNLAKVFEVVNQSLLACGDPAFLANHPQPTS